MQNLMSDQDIRTAIGKALTFWDEGPGDLRSTNALADLLERRSDDTENFAAHLQEFYDVQSPARIAAEELMAKLPENPTFADMREALAAEHEK